MQVLDPGAGSLRVEREADEHADRPDRDVVGLDELVRLGQADRLDVDREAALLHQVGLDPVVGTIGVDRGDRSELEDPTVARAGHRELTADLELFVVDEGAPEVADEPRDGVLVDDTRGHCLLPETSLPLYFGGEDLWHLP